MKRNLVLLLCVLVLAAACAGPKTEEPTAALSPTAMATATRRPTSVLATRTPRPTSTATATRTSIPTRTPRPTATPTLTRTPIPTPTRYVRAAATPTPVPTETPVVSGQGGGPVATPVPLVAPAPLLAVLEDTDPGPPFDITVSANRALDGSVTLVSGWVRNESDETYEAIGVLATFTDGEGFYWGPIDTRCPCTLLAPGESCPFIVEASMRRPTAVLLHPQGRPSKRQSVPAALSGVRSVSDGLDSIRLTGTAVNEQPYKIKNPIVVGMLVDPYGQIVSLGYTFVTVEDIEPGAGVPFSLRVKQRPYAQVRTYVQAERDWQ